MSLPWHPRNHQDALDGMLMLTLEERGAYNTLLDLIYQRAGPIPDDERWLAGWMGCSVKKWRLLRSSLLVKGKISECEHNRQPGLMNDRAALELESASTRRRVAAESGATGGRKSAQNRTKPNENNADSVPSLEGSLKLLTLTGTDKEDIAAPLVREPASKDEWVDRLAEATELAGAGLDRTALPTHTYRDLKALCEPASGEPCLWPEVLDAVRHEAAKAIRTGRPIRSWTWVNERALAFRDRRLAGLPDPKIVTLAQGASSLAERIGADSAEAKRRALEQLSAQNG